ncbi:MULTISPECIES: EpsG family protein [unclassified Romboutsia]|uniref:EpsG family protein n=1 Tax=unclassified Romboutsia TaxID=2626894 RepID=UPI0008234993|nr:MULTISPECIES: EpsG family protein [unclassified Romboutsia]SCH20332.1 Uncharacterised protein [uncultured Clostridium sp.]
MEVYIFMLCWVIVFGIMSQMTSKYIAVGNEVYESRVNIFMAFVTFSVIIFFSGLRSGIADTWTYIDMFKEYPLLSSAKDVIFDSEAREPGFRLFSILIKTYISDDFHIWLFIIASITGICIVYTLYKYSSNYGLSVLLFMLSCQFTWMLNGMRQFLVAAIMFACTGLILNRKFLLYVIIVLLLSTFHLSVLIMIPAYFIIVDEPWSKRSMIFIAVIVFALIFTDKFTSLLEVVIENSDYASSMNEFKDTDDGTNVIRILVESVPVILAFIYRDILKDKLTPIIKISINMSLISSGVYIISKIARSGIMLGRLPIYFSLYNLILLPWLIKNIFAREEKRLVNYSMIVLYGIFFYYQMVVAWNGVGYYSDILNIFLSS